MLQGDVDTASANAATSVPRAAPQAARRDALAVAPTWGDSDPPSGLADLAGAVKKAVTAVGGTYLSVRDPVRGHPDYMADDADPDDAGYAAIAKALAPRLRPLLAG